MSRPPLLAEEGNVHRVIGGSFYVILRIPCAPGTLVSLFYCQPQHLQPIGLPCAAEFSGMTTPTSPVQRSNRLAASAESGWNPAQPSNITPYCTLPFGSSTISGEIRRRVTTS